MLEKKNTQAFVQEESSNAIKKEKKEKRKINLKVFIAFIICEVCMTSLASFLVSISNNNALLVLAYIPLVFLIIYIYKIKHPKKK